MFIRTVKVYINSIEWATGIGRMLNRNDRHLQHVFDLLCMATNWMVDIQVKILQHTNILSVSLPLMLLHCKKPNISHPWTSWNATLMSWNHVTKCNELKTKEKEGVQNVRCSIWNWTIFKWTCMARRWKLRAFLICSGLLGTVVCLSNRELTLEKTLFNLVDCEQ